MTEMVTIYPRGVRTEVPVDVCRCPILEVGDACPVHQEILDVERHFHGDPRGDPRLMMRQLYFTVEEIAVLIVALAESLEPGCHPHDVTEASSVVWSSVHSTSIQRSLATALAEATY